MKKVIMLFAMVHVSIELGKAAQRHNMTVRELFVEAAKAGYNAPNLKESAKAGYRLI